jgi:hypothetical protein
MGRGPWSADGECWGDAALHNSRWGRVPPPEPIFRPVAPPGGELQRPKVEKLTPCNSATVTCGATKFHHRMCLVTLSLSFEFQIDILTNEFLAKKRIFYFFANSFLCNFLMTPGTP